MMFTGKFSYYNITVPVMDLFAKKDKKLYYEIRENHIYFIPVVLQDKGFVYKADPWWWDMMLSPECLMYRKCGDCSSWARFWFEVLKYKNTSCRMYGLTGKDSGHAVVFSGNDLYSNLNVHKSYFSIEQANAELYKDKYTEIEMIMEYVAK